MVHIEDVTTTSETPGSEDGVPHKRRVHFSNEVSEREADDGDQDGDSTEVRY